MVMVPVEFQSMDINSLMRISTADISRKDSYLWLMLVQTLMALNSSLPLVLHPGKNMNIVFIIFIRLDGAHVVFGELVEGDNIL